jgi:hypothetical protein
MSAAAWFQSWSAFAEFMANGDPGDLGGEAVGDVPGLASKAINSGALNAGARDGIFQDGLPMINGNLPLGVRRRRLLGATEFQSTGGG